MRVGLIGAGNMAGALARGWGDPVLCCDAGSGRAQALAGELGGEALATPAEVAERAELIVLAHKPAALKVVASEVSGAGPGKPVVSVLAGVELAALGAVYGDAPVLRLMPNTPVAVRQGVCCLAAPEDAPPALVQEVTALFSRLGTVQRIPERLMGVATALMGVGPAYAALLIEAQVDAGVRYGLPAPLAGQLVAETMAGTATLLGFRGYDTLAVRHEVASPGGVTARGLAALERGGIRAAFQDAIDAVLAGERAR